MIHYVRKDGKKVRADINTVSRVGDVNHPDSYRSTSYNKDLVNYMSFCSGKEDRYSSNDAEFRTSKFSLLITGKRS